MATETPKSNTKVDAQGRKTDVKGRALRGDMDVTSPGLPADAVVEPGQGELAERFKEDQERGFRGTPADPTPNEHYTVAGVTDPSKHVPEEFKQQTGVTVMPDVNYGQK